MAMMDSSHWNGQDHAMHAGPEDDFQQFLDMGGIANLPDGLNFDFQDFQGSNGANMMAGTPREQLDTAMTGTDAPVILSTNDPALQHQMPPMTSATSYRTIPTTMVPPHTQNEAIIDSIDTQIQILQHQKMQHQQRQLEEQHAVFFANQQNRIVPPTPQSLEMPAGQTPNQFYSQPSQAESAQQHAIDYRYQRLKDQQEMFTPLVSPAVTPLETHFPVDAQFTVPGAYFSPLTSPALHAQNDPLAVFDPRHGPVNNNSPVEMELETNTGAVGSSNSAELAKKARKGATKVRGKTGIRQSPISKPQRRKTTTTPNLTAQVLTELVEGAEAAQDRQVQLAVPAGPTSTSSATGATDSENGSVSPEALNDSVSHEMPPPPIPKPRSARPSPYIAPQTNGTATNLAPRPGAPSPATPASLMKLSSPNNRNGAARDGSQEPVDTEHIEIFELPESANFSRPNLTPINTRSPMQSPPTPGQNMAKGTNFQPLPSPVFAKPTAAASATQSPQLTPGGSNVRKTPLLVPRGSKKRASGSTVQHSPALRPKISPNIKPLLPGGASAEETASHLLATKSNYQRILDGNTLPGVSYPSELSTNLTSKRTSHKIAEQGRRNRINSALQEIATLLPRQPPTEGKGSDDGESGDKKDKSNSTPNSKASTVEMAIEYIKQLRQQVEDANRRADEAEKRLGLKESEEEVVE